MMEVEAGRGGDPSRPSSHSHFSGSLSSCNLHTLCCTHTDIFRMDGREHVGRLEELLHATSSFPQGQLGGHLEDFSLPPQSQHREWLAGGAAYARP